jgi:hypothetical protein
MPARKYHASWPRPEGTYRPFSTFNPRARVFFFKRVTECVAF